MAGKNDKSQGQLVADGMNSHQKRQAIAVAGDVVNDFQAAMNVFSSMGKVGKAVDLTAPGVTMDPGAVLPQLTQLSPSERAASRMDLLYALFDPSFQDALHDFQYRLAGSAIDTQVNMLGQFSSIDWESLSKPAFDGQSNLLQKIQGMLYQRSQLNGVKSADLNELLVLTRVPQFVQMLKLAGGYGKVMLVAYRIFGENQTFLDRDNDENQAIIAKLDTIVSRFSLAEERRLASAEQVAEYTDQLRKALELTSVLADLDNRSSEMLGRINIDKLLVAAMGENTQQTIESQKALLEEMSRSLHLVVSNQTRQARVQRAVASLNLYIKCYVAFEFLLTMLQVYILTASTAIQTVLAQNIQAVGAQVGDSFYTDNIAPLKEVIDHYVKTFRLPQLPEEAEVIAQ